MDHAMRPQAAGGVEPEDGADDSVGRAVVRPRLALHVVYLGFIVLLAGVPLRQFMAGDYVEPIGLLPLLGPLLLYFSFLLQRCELDEAGIRHRSVLGTRHHTWDEVEEVVLPEGHGRWRSAHVRVDEWPSRVEIGGPLSRQLGEDAHRVAAEMARRHGVPVRMKADGGAILWGLLAALLTAAVLTWGAVTIYG